MIVMEKNWKVFYKEKKEEEPALHYETVVTANTIEQALKYAESDLEEQYEIVGIEKE